MDGNLSFTPFPACSAVYDLFIYLPPDIYEPDRKKAEILKYIRSVMISHVARTIGPEDKAGSILTKRNKNGRQEPTTPDRIIDIDMDIASAAPRFEFACHRVAAPPTSMPHMRPTMTPTTISLCSSHLTSFNAALPRAIFLTTMVDDCIPVLSESPRTMGIKSANAIADFISRSNHPRMKAHASPLNMLIASHGNLSRTIRRMECVVISSTPVPIIFAISSSASSSAISTISSAVI